MRSISMTRSQWMNTSISRVPSRNLSSSAADKKGRTNSGAAANTTTSPNHDAASANFCRIDSVAIRGDSESDCADSSIPLIVSCHCLVKKLQCFRLPIELDYQRGDRDPFRCNFYWPLCIFDHEATLLDVISPCLVLRLSQPDLALQFLSVVGSCLGVAIFLRGLRLRRAWIQASSKANADSSQRTENVAAHPTQETIRLTTDLLPVKSAEMTQQQKIAAALARAGTSHSTGRGHESTGVAVEATEPDPLEQETTADEEVHSVQLKPTPISAYTSHLLIWCGLALAVLSCCLLVTIR